MGVLRKKPGDKLKINKIRLWGYISMIALVVGLGVAFIPKSFNSVDAQINLGDLIGNNSSRVGESFRNRGWCPEAPEGFTAVCGVVIEGDPDLENFGQQLSNIKIEVWEGTVETRTRLVDGELVHPFSSTVTNEQGRFHVNVRTYGAPDNKVTIIPYCGESRGRAKEISSIEEIYDLPLEITCPNYESVTPRITPSSTSIGAYSIPEGYLECTLNGENATISYKDSGEVFAKLRFADTTLDDRFSEYPGVNVFGVGVGSFDGALWSKDCEASGRPECYEEVTSTDGSGAGPATKDDYITKPHIDSIPKGPDVMLPIQFETRFTEDTSASPRTGAKILQALGMDPFLDVFIRRSGQEFEEELPPSSDLLECNQTVSSTDSTSNRNTRLCSGHALSLASPGIIREMYERNGGEFARDKNEYIVEHNGTPIKVGEIQPTWDACNMDAQDCYSSSGTKYLLPKEYFNAILALPDSGGGYYNKTEPINDSYKTIARHDPWNYQEPADDPYATENLTVNYPDTIRGNNTATGAIELGATGDGVDYILADVLKSPGAEREEYVGTGIAVNEISNDLYNLCGLSRVNKQNLIEIVVDAGNELEVAVHNAFTGTNEHALYGDALPQYEQGVAAAGTAGYQSNLSFERDAVLSDRSFSIFNGETINPRWRDFWDSMKTSLSKDKNGAISSVRDGLDATVSALAGLNIFTLGSAPDQKSFTQRKVVEELELRRDDVLATYKLHEENFEQFFPLPTKPYTKDKWGGHPDYPWNPASSCDGRYEENGVYRTCRIESCFHTLTDNKKIECTPDEYTEAYNAGKDGNSIPGWEINMEVAGPYIGKGSVAFVGDFETKQLDGDYEASDVDVSMMMATKALRSPYTTELSQSDELSLLNYKTSRAAETDSLENFGYKAKAFGSGTLPFIHRAVASPAKNPISNTEGTALNPVIYHCDNFAQVYPQALQDIRFGGVEPTGWECIAIEIPEIVSSCDGSAWGAISGVPSSDTALGQAKGTWEGNIKTNYLANTYILDVYGQLESETGIPCEVFAGIHWVEGGSEPDRGFREGELISPTREALYESGVSAATLIKAAASSVANANLSERGVPQDWQTLVGTFSNYNGSGNQQCWSDAENPETPYAQAGKCPADFYAEDSMYALSMIDSKHYPMYLRFCGDHEACDPYPVWERPGAGIIAILFGEEVK